MRHPNAARGEVLVALDGEPYVVALTMAALSKIEHAVGATSMVDMSVRLARLTAAQMLDVTAILIEAGGQPAPARAIMEAWPARVMRDMQAMLEAVFSASGMTESGDGEKKPAAAATAQHPGANGSASPAAIPTTAA